MKVSEVLPFSGIDAAPNALMITGGTGIMMFAVTIALSTVAFACPVPPVFPAVNIAVAVPFT